MSEYGRSSFSRRQFDLEKPVERILDATRLEVDTFSQVKSHRYYSNCLIKVSHDAKALASLRVINSASHLIKDRSYEAELWCAIDRDFWGGRCVWSNSYKEPERVVNFFNLTMKYNNEFFDSRNSPSFFHFLLSFGDSGGSLYTFIVRLFLRREKNYIHWGSVADNKAHNAPLARISLRALNARILSVSRSTKRKYSRSSVRESWSVIRGKRTQKAGGDWLQSGHYRNERKL